MHRAQQTDGVKALLKKKNTELVNVPPGCTSRVQPLDVFFNKPFKDVIRQQFMFMFMCALFRFEVI